MEAVSSNEYIEKQGLLTCRIRLIGAWFIRGDRKRKLMINFSMAVAVIVIVISLSGCNIVPTNCGSSNEFAYVGTDGNVYKYNLCEKESLQLTSDADLTLSENAVLSGHYSLSDQAWSPQRNYILAGFHGLGNPVFLLNVNDGAKFSFGDLESANWSPTGAYLVLVRSGNRGDEGYDEDVYVFDMKSAKEIYHDPGRAPFWFDDNSLMFLQAKQAGDIHNRVQELWRRDFADDGSGETIPLSVKVESVNPPHMYANQISLSSDDRWAAVFVPGIVGMSEIRLFNFQTNQFLTEGALPLPDGTVVTRRWTTDSDFGWSPSGSVLAFCNGGGGADDAYNDLYGGALFLINEGHLIPVTESKCGRTKISWSPIGDRVAYLNNTGGISVVDHTGNLLFGSSEIEVRDSTNLKAQEGPWWSPDGTLISLVADNKICLAPMNDEILQLTFECIVDGSMMVWKP